jgi:glycosyltransferase involved in cell wall biosynthesis
MRRANSRLAARLHPVYLRNPRLVEALRRPGPLRFIYYLIWQTVTCRRAALRLHTSIRFDVCQHVTYAADWAPAGVAHVRGLPFVWGPVGGSASLGSARLAILLGWRTALSELVRAAILTPLRLLIGRPLARRAAVVLGQNQDVAHVFAPVPVQVEPHVALEGMKHDRIPSGDGPPRAIWAGRLLGWKGMRLALLAMRRPAAAAWHLDIYGDGVERTRLERLAIKWGVDDRVHFHGQRPRTEVTQAMAGAAVMLFPSIHDAAGWSVAEALDAGCPVVALRMAGPATLVGLNQGLLVDPTGDVVGALAASLDQARELQPTGERWHADRLPDLITNLYQQAVGVAGGAVPSQVATSPAAEGTATDVC